MQAVELEREAAKRRVMIPPRVATNNLRPIQLLGLAKVRSKPSDVLSLQHLVGNRALQRLLCDERPEANVQRNRDDDLPPVRRAWEVGGGGGAAAGGGGGGAPVMPAAAVAAPAVAAPAVAAPAVAGHAPAPAAESRYERAGRYGRSVLSSKAGGVALAGATIGGMTARHSAVAAADATAAVATGHASTNFQSTQAFSAEGGGVGVGLGGAAFLGGAGLLGYGLYKRNQGIASGDRAKQTLGGRTARGGGWLMAGGAASTAVGGLELASKLGKTGAAIAPAAFGLMIAGGAVTAARGLWKLGKSISRIRSLGEVKPVTEDGRMWLARAKNRAKNKAAISTFKTVLGGLGIAAGALLLASNPIGWAIGLGAAIIGGIGTIAGLRNKAHQIKSDTNDKQGMSNEQRAAIQQARDDGAARERLAVPGERKRARQTTSEATAALHSNLQVGMQIHDALVAPDTNTLNAGQIVHLGSQQGEDEFPFSPAVTASWSAVRRTSRVPALADFRALDALMLCQALNVSRQEAVSPSGAELIQQKLSAADAA